jgi:hypothetical protein
MPATRIGKSRPTREFTIHSVSPPMPSPRSTIAPLNAAHQDPSISPSCSRSCLPAMRSSPPHARRPRPADNRACPRPSSKGSRDQNSSCPTSPNPGLTRVGASRSAISGPDNRAAGRGVLSPGSGALGTCPDSRSPRRSPSPPTPSPSRGSGPRGWGRSGSGQVLRAAIPAASASGRRCRRGAHRPQRRRPDCAPDTECRGLGGRQRVMTHGRTLAASTTVAAVAAG